MSSCPSPCPKQTRTRDFLELRTRTRIWTRSWLRTRVRARACPKTSDSDKHRTSLHARCTEDVPKMFRISIGQNIQYLQVNCILTLGLVRWLSPNWNNCEFLRSCWSVLSKANESCLAHCSESLPWFIWYGPRDMDHMIWPISYG